MKTSNKIKLMICSIIILMSGNVIYGQQLAYNANLPSLNKLPENPGIAFNNNIVHADVKTMEEKDRIQLWVYNKDEKKLNISLSSETQELWAINSSDPYISRILNVSSLEDGAYAIEIKYGKTRITKNLFIHSHTKTEKNIQIK
jgi:hypothetical protein